MTDKRFDRNIRFFGKEGQIRIASAKVALVGIGGLGTHVLQQLSLLGVGHLSLIDAEELDETNLNRYAGVQHYDSVSGILKVNLGYRIAKGIDPNINVLPIAKSLVSDEAYDAIIGSDYVFGCLDSEGARLILNELCASYSKPYFDLASDIVSDTNCFEYGGRVCIAWDGNGCLVCHDEIDIAEAQSDLLTPEARKNRDNIYGVPKQELSGPGPSVVSINGVIASIAVTEFMLSVTGIRKPKSVLTYKGTTGIVTSRKDAPLPDCYYCKSVRGQADATDARRYIREGIIP